MIEDNRSEKEKLARLKELMEPIDQQLMMCDDYRDQLLLVSAMMLPMIDTFALPPKVAWKVVNCWLRASRLLLMTVMLFWYAA